MTTETFCITPQLYMRQLAYAWIARRWYLLTLPLAAVAIWACYDLRAVYVGLIIVFLVFPMVMSMVWFNYAFSTAALKAVAPKQLSLTDDAIHITYADDEQRRMIFEPETISKKDIRSVELHSGYVTIVCGRSLDSRIIVERAALTDDMLWMLRSWIGESSDAMDVF